MAFKKVKTTGIERELSHEQEQKAQIVAILSDLEVKKGVVMPQDVLELARDESSPLHDQFQWDDRIAGEAYRLNQARNLINSVRVEFMGSTTDAYINATVRIEKEPVRGYFSVARVMSDEQIYAAVLRKALGELRHYIQRYENMKEIKQLINIKELEKLEA